MTMKENIELIRKAFENISVKAVAIEDIRGLVLPNGTTLSATKGDKIEAPRWIIGYLEEKGLAKRLWEEVGLEDIIRIHYRELDRKSIKEISRLPDNFYFLVKEYMDHLDKIIREKPDPNILNERQRIENYVNEIVNKRLQAIMLLSLNVDDPAELGGKLSPEELELFREIKEKIAEWFLLIFGKRRLGV